MQKLVAAALAASTAVGLGVVVRAQAPSTSAANRAAAGTYRAPRTPWGDPDLQGKWPSGHMSGVPLQRPESFGTRNELTDKEFADREGQSARQTAEDVADFDFENPSIPFGQIGGGQSPPQHWLERGTPQRQVSLIVDPPNGRMPALTPGAQKREADRRAGREPNGPSWLAADFSLYERCITRGVPGSMLPGGYGNGNEIVQSPGYVTILNEMVHEARIVPLDGRAHLASPIRGYMGHSRGRWDGDTLVVETTNFVDRRGVGVNGSGASDTMTITERFSRTGDATIRYSLTVSDPTTWTAPVTIQYDLARDDKYGMYEYACHEGNYALQNILRGAASGK